MEQPHRILTYCHNQQLFGLENKVTLLRQCCRGPSSANYVQLRALNGYPQEKTSHAQVYNAEWVQQLLYILYTVQCTNSFPTHDTFPRSKGHKIYTYYGRSIIRAKQCKKLMFLFYNLTLGRLNTTILLLFSIMIIQRFCILSPQPNCLLGSHQYSFYVCRPEDKKLL